MFFLQDIGVGVKVLCFWRSSEDRTDQKWYIRRNDTKAEFSMDAGMHHERSVHAVSFLVAGINLGLELQGKMLKPMGFSKLDVVEEVQALYYTTGGHYTENPFPHRDTKSWLCGVGSERSLSEILFNESSIDRKHGNFGFLYEVAAVP